MSAIADLMRALMPFGVQRDGAWDATLAARDAFRKHAPCDGCNGKGDKRYAVYPSHDPCEACSGAGWTPASVEAAIARAEELAQLDAAVLRAADVWYPPTYGSKGMAETDILCAAIGARRAARN